MVINFANTTRAKFNDDVNLTEPINTFFDSTKSAYWCTVGGDNGSPALGFFDRIDFLNSSHLGAVYLEGPNVGRWDYVPWKINVTESFGKYLYPPPRRTGAPEDSSSGPSTGLIVGCVVGGLAIIGVAVFLFIFYSRRMTKQFNEANAAKEQQQHQNVAPDHFEQDLKQKPYAAHNTHLPATQVAVPASVAPLGPSLQQQINLSSHPRPGFVSTLTEQPGDKTEIEDEPSTLPANFLSSPLGTSQAPRPQVPLHSRPPQQ